MLPEIRWLDIIDIAIVSVMMYYVLLWLQGTRALSLIRGLILILVVYVAGRFLGLHTINWLFDRFAAIIALMLVILFQPELRRMLERFGRRRYLGFINFSSPSQGGLYVRRVVRAAEQMAEEHTGGLIVIERATGLNEYLESGVRLDSIISTEIILSIFNQKSPLHDGAIIIQGERIAAAGCLLPISDNRLVDKRLGTRHRAALGISEMSDALVIIISEKTGVISIAENGYLTRYMTKDMLEEKLFSIFKADRPKGPLISWGQKKREQQKD